MEIEVIFQYGIFVQVSFPLDLRSHRLAEPAEKIVVNGLVQEYGGLGNNQRDEADFDIIVIDFLQEQRNMQMPPFSLSMTRHRFPCLWAKCAKVEP